MSKKIKEFVTDADESTVLSTKNYNENRTIIFQTSKKVHQSDSIAWVVGSVTFFLFLVLSAGRFLTVGAFLDDIFFNFIFGWLKYPVYLVLMVFDLSILFGLQFSVKKQFLGMILVICLSAAWIISTSLLIDLKVKGLDEVKLWDKEMFTKSMRIYTDNWYDNSIFSAKFRDVTGHRKFLIYPSFGYINLYQGGGFFGNFLAGIFGYATLPVSLVLGFFALFLALVWFLTGNPFFLFLPKAKQKGKRVRVLALKHNNNPHDTKKPLFSLTTNQDQATELDNVELWGDQSLPISSAAVLEPAPIGAVVEPPVPPIKRDFSAINWDEPDDDYETFTMFGEEEDIDSNYQTATQQLVEQDRLGTRVDPNIGIYGFKPLKEPTLETFTADHVVELDDSAFFDEILKETSLAAAQTPSGWTTTDQLAQDEVLAQQNVQKNYDLPGLELLNHHQKDDNLVVKNQAIAEQKAQAINDVFAQFKVRAEVVNIIVGPTVTKFEIKPAQGTKINAISSLENDLKVALASQDIRLEAPIPNKNLVGIEVSNEFQIMVGLREILADIPTKDEKNKLLFGLGKDTSDQAVFGDIKKMPHLLIAGSTGAGKSVMINALIVSLLLRTKPSEVKLLLIDPKQVELAIYTNVPHMLAPVISEVGAAINALKVVVAEMDRRYALFTKSLTKNIETYNEKQAPDQQLPYLVVIIDELADLMLTTNKKEVEEVIQRITQMARAAGIHLIVATQRPSVDIITGVIKSNIPSRIAFRVASGIDSRTILNTNGAEHLIGRGDMLYNAPNSNALARIQGAYLSDAEIERVVDYVCAQQDPLYAKAFNSLNQSQVGGQKQQQDPLYQEALNQILSANKASASFLKRRLKISFNQASEIIDQMEEAGVLGPANGAKSREIYYKPK